METIKIDDVKYLDELYFNDYENSWLSHSYKCDFIIDNKKFNCVEQYLIYEKARTFNDSEVMDLVMKESNPDKMHFLGRQIKNYDENIWTNKRYDVSYTGNFEKFDQNSDLFNKLKQTKYSRLIYKSRDNIWGNGVDNSGKDLLGHILTTIRDNRFNSYVYSMITKNADNFQHLTRFGYQIGKDDFEFMYKNNIKYFFN